MEALVSHLHVALLRQGPLDVVVAFGSQLNLILAAGLQGGTLHRADVNAAKVLVGFYYIFIFYVCRSYQQASESEATLLVGDSVLAVQAAVSLAHRLHRHVPLRVAAQRLHGSVAAEETSGHTLWSDSGRGAGNLFFTDSTFTKTNRLPAG